MSVRGPQNLRRWVLVRFLWTTVYMYVRVANVVLYLDRVDCSNVHSLSACRRCRIRTTVFWATLSWLLPSTPAGIRHISTRSTSSPNRLVSFCFDTISTARWAPTSRLPTINRCPTLNLFNPLERVFERIRSIFRNLKRRCTFFKSVQILPYFSH